MSGVRIQRRRTKGWRMPKKCVAVTRPGVLGNPFTGTEAISRHRVWLLDMLDVSKPYREVYLKWADWPSARKLMHRRAEIDAAIHDIAENDLSVACFCAEGKPCHGDVILELAAKIRKGERLK